MLEYIIVYIKLAFNLSQQLLKGAIDLQEFEAECAKFLFKGVRQNNKNKINKYLILTQWYKKSIVWKLKVTGERQGQNHNVHWGLYPYFKKCFGGGERAKLKLWQCSLLLVSIRIYAIPIPEINLFFKFYSIQIVYEV